MIQLRIARGCGPTGRLLRDLLKERGLDVTLEPTPGVEAVVCYGLGGTTAALPTLNANASKLDKYQQFEKLAAAGVKIPPFFVNPPTGFADFPYPWLARKRQHHGGTDIMLVLQQEDFQLRKNAGAEFFTQYIPRDTEYRVWIYRRRHLGTYQKVLAHPEKYTTVGCNYDNGFAFELVKQDQLPREAIDLAAKAVEALDLDFGACDILKGKDGKFYVLEVNTAPGVDGARQGIVGLANRIVRWAELDYVKRKGAQE